MPERQEEQKTLEFSARECAALLEHRLKLPPTPWTDTSRRIDGEQLRLILLALFRSGHEGKREAFPSYQTIARMAGCSRSTAIRGVQALVRLGALLPPEVRHFGRCRSSNRYIINWSVLGQYAVEAQPLFNRPAVSPTPVQPDPTPAQPDPTPAQPDPTLVQPDPTPGSTVRLGGGTVRLGGGTVPPPQAHGAPLTLNDLFVTTMETDVSARSSREHPAKSVSPSNRRFSFEEWKLIQATVKATMAWLYDADPEEAGTFTDADYEVLLKVATMLNDRVLPEEWVASVRRSIETKRRRGKPVERPIGYLISSLQEQSRHRGRDFGKMLKATPWPRDWNTDAAPTEH